MLHPSYTELMEKINQEENQGDEPVINSRYSIVIATSKRARELIAGSKSLEGSIEGEKPLSLAVKELYNSKIRILHGEEGEIEDELDFAEDINEENASEITEDVSPVEEEWSDLNQEEDEEKRAEESPEEDNSKENSMEDTEEE